VISSSNSDGSRFKGKKCVEMSPCSLLSRGEVRGGVLVSSRGEDVSSGGNKQARILSFNEEDSRKITQLDGV